MTSTTSTTVATAPERQITQARLAKDVAAITPEAYQTAKGKGGKALERFQRDVIATYQESARVEDSAKQSATVMGAYAVRLSDDAKEGLSNDQIAQKYLVRPNGTVPNDTWVSNLRKIGRLIIDKGFSAENDAEFSTLLRIGYSWPEVGKALKTQGSTHDSILKALQSGIEARKPKPAITGGKDEPKGDEPKDETPESETPEETPENTRGPQEDIDPKGGIETAENATGGTLTRGNATKIEGIRVLVAGLSDLSDADLETLIAVSDELQEVIAAAHKARA